MSLAAIRSHTRKLTVAVYLAVVLLPVALLGTNGPWLGKGDLHIRGRADFPKRFGPGSFQEFDGWFADRIGLRYPLIYLGTEFHLGAFGRTLDRRIFFGPDHWMFWTEDGEKVPSAMADSRGRLRFTPGEIKRVETQLLAMRERFAACGIPFAVVVAPNKQSIYREFVMRNAAAAPPSRLDGLLAALDPAARALIVDTRETIRPAKARHAPVRLYNKTETHWNELGAFYGYAAIMDGLRRAGAPGHAAPAAIDQYDISVQPYAGGDMATFVLFSPWRYPDENVSVRRKTPETLIREQIIDPRTFIARNPNGRGKLLLIGDSFTHGPVRYLQQHFAEVHRVISTSVDGEAVARLRPDAVLMLVVERNLEHLLRPSVNLAKTCGG
jgi:hypothetical protein